MSTDRCWALLRGLVLLSAGAMLSAACGGSAEVDGGVAGSRSGALGGASGMASGGGSNCPTIDCPTNCPAGYAFVQPDSPCCGMCVPSGAGNSGGASDCSDVSCPVDSCPSGMKLEQPPDGCCATCVPDLCAQGQSGYQALYDALMAMPSAISCTNDKECTLLKGSATCGDFCTTHPVNAAAAVDIEAQLDQFGDDQCSTCSNLFPPPCLGPFPPSCEDGVCLIVPPHPR